MKPENHESLFKSRAAGDVTVTKYKRGKVVSVQVIKAGTVDTARLDIESKRGPKPGLTEAGTRANRFAAGAVPWGAR